jgi:lipopolysaccharide heptosyltransferase II
MTERILVVGPSWVGDMVMAQSLFKALKQRYSDSTVDVLAPEWSRPIINRMPEINESISMPLSHGQFDLKTRYQLGRDLRSRQYTQAIILPRSFKAALVPWFAKIPVRTGYRGEMRFGLINDVRQLDKTVLTQTVQRYVALGVDKKASLPPSIIYPELTVNKDNQKKIRSELSLHLDKPIVAFLPGAEYGPAKCWPTDYFAELACKLNEQGKQVWVFGSKKEIELGKQIKQGSPSNVENLCGKTQLADVVDLLACAEQVISNDSGLMHVACSVGVNVVGIYGSSSADYTPPLSKLAKVVKHDIECSPCFQRTCQYGHYDCLKKITPEIIDETINIKMEEK